MSHRFDERAERRAPTSDAHEEWLQDEAVAETFPASDPPATSYPGSIVYNMTVRRAPDGSQRMLAAVAGAALLATGIGLLLARRRRASGRAA